MQEFIPPKPFETAVLFLVFNRLDTAKEVFAEIKKAKPPRLYIASDGAREVKHGESDIVNAVRNYILDNIDWDCEVKTLFRDQNLGCKYAVSSAITWFFDNEEQGIILEDDCLPSQSFFWYCEELLNKYKNNDKVKVISGDNRFDQLTKNSSELYSFMSYALIWGWASWRRVWQSYDVELTSISEPEFLNSKFYKNKRRRVRRYWLKIFREMKSNKPINTWDYQLSFSIFIRDGVCIVPNTNLISNIGFGDGATHTLQSDGLSSNYPRKEINLRKKHLEKIHINHKLEYIFENACAIDLPFMARVIRKIIFLYNKL